ncbi:MAG: hypothetical protein K6G88_08715 [Lachnospiraceae bacterium]|nr:hypothetical protein [Lachnospiraceae bacterium]
MTWDKFYVVCGILGLLFGFVTIINTTSGSDHRKLEEQLEKNEVDYADVKADLDCGKRYKNIVIGEKYAMAYSMGTKFINGNNLAWVYPKIEEITTTIFFIIPVSRQKMYSIECYTFFNETITITNGFSEKKFEEIMNELVKIAPGVLYGESKEWTKMRRDNPEEFLNMARQSRIRAESKQMSEKYMERYGFVSDYSYDKRFY